MLTEILLSIDDYLLKKQIIIDMGVIVDEIKTTKQFILLQTVPSIDADFFASHFIGYCAAQGINTELILELFKTMIDRVQKASVVLRDPLFAFLINPTDQNFKEGYLL